MSITHWLSNHLGRSRRPASRRNTPTLRPTLEALEDRWLPSTLTVLNNLDSGAGSLRAGIAAALNGDTIVFAPSLVGQTITLTSGELLIKQSITIAGPGAGNLTVSGNHASRVFEVSEGKGKGKNVTVILSGLTIGNGMVNGNGGGILNNGTLSVSSSILSGNSASDYGGGIANYGPLTVSACALSSNSATYGGGIFNNGTLTVNSSIISGNSASKNGGGIANVNTLTVSDSTLSGNSAAQGGGIASFVGTVTVSGCTLSSNSATVSGGGIYNRATLTVKNTSSITGNTAPVGFGADVYNLSVLYLDSTSTIGLLDGNPWVPS
jgi:predicted outer membrane repeat protein